MLVSMTSAPPTAPPDGSLTTPRSDVVACPHNGAAHASNASISICAARITALNVAAVIFEPLEKEKTMRRLEFMVSTSGKKTVCGRNLTKIR